MAEIRVPTLGELVTEATIGKWFKQAGDAVMLDEPLVELETDKVTVEVPAPAAGVLTDIAAKGGRDGAGRSAARPDQGTGRNSRGRRGGSVPADGTENGWCGARQGGGEGAGARAASALR